jgi:hypothetical protein
MAENLVIESPDFEAIRARAGYEASDAVKLLWFALNAEIKLRQQTVRRATDTLEGKVFTTAPTSRRASVDAGRATVVHFNSSTAFTLTGIRNGVEGRILFFHNTGSGTVTFDHQSGSSVATNRIVTDDTTNQAVATSFSFGVQYLSNRWRHMSFV